MFPGLERKSLGSAKVCSIQTFEDVCNYIKSSNEMMDYTTLGLDRKNFKAALHKILKHVGLFCLTSS